MIEKWKEIEGTKGKYFVSDLGRVKSIKKSGEYILKPSKNTRGYLFINIQGKSVMIHRLVAGAFITKPNDKFEVNHKDFDKTNNSKNNLEWVSHRTNIRHFATNGGNIDDFIGNFRIHSFRIEINLLNELKSFAMKSKVSQSYIIREAIISYCSNYKNQ